MAAKVQLTGNFDAIAVTPNDSTDIPLTSGIFVGGAGNISVTMQSGKQITFTAPQVGTILPIHAKRVWATGTTATNLIALY